MNYAFLIVSIIFMNVSFASKEIDPEIVQKDEKIPDMLRKLSEYVPEDQRKLCNAVLFKACAAIGCENDDDIFQDCSIEIVKDHQSPIRRIDIKVKLLTWSVIYYFYEKELCLLIMDDIGLHRYGGRVKTPHTPESLALKVITLDIMTHHNYVGLLDNNIKDLIEKRRVDDALTLSTLNLPHELKVEVYKFNRELDGSKGVIIKSRTTKRHLRIGIDPKNRLFLLRTGQKPKFI